MQTTMNIKESLYLEITRAAELRGISRSAMIIELLRTSMNDDSNEVQIGRLVQYQKRETMDRWHPFHITFREDEFEFFQDMRKFFKKSLSLVLAEAVKKYLNHILKKEYNTDNYPHTCYVIIREMINTIVSWRLIWGLPPTLAHIMEQTNTLT
jgi:hypothetical protein